PSLGAAEAERDELALLQRLRRPGLRRPLDRVDGVLRTDRDLVEEEPAGLAFTRRRVADFLHDPVDVDPAAVLLGRVAVDVDQLRPQRLVVVEVDASPGRAVVEEDPRRLGVPGLLSYRTL